MVEVNIRDKELWEIIKKHCGDDFKDQLCKPFDFGGVEQEEAVGGVLAEAYYGGTDRFLRKELPLECIRHGRAVKVGGRWFKA